MIKNEMIAQIPEYVENDAQARAIVKQQKTLMLQELPQGAENWQNLTEQKKEQILRNEVVLTDLKNEVHRLEDENAERNHLKIIFDDKKVK